MQGAREDGARGAELPLPPLRPRGLLQEQPQTSHPLHPYCLIRTRDSVLCPCGHCPCGHCPCGHCPCVHSPCVYTATFFCTRMFLYTSGWVHMLTNLFFCLCRICFAILVYYKFVHVYCLALDMNRCVCGDVIQTNNLHKESFRPILSM